MNIRACFGFRYSIFKSMSSYLHQALFIWLLLQLLFGYFEFRYKPDVFYIVGRLFSRKYLVPSLIIPVVYIIILALLKYLIR